MNNYMLLTLTESEILLSAIAGVQRQCHVIKDGLKGDENEPTDNCWHRHIEGAMTECVMAKYLDKYWKGKGEPGAGDIGNIEVRSATEHHYRLILHPKDKDDSIYWFLTGQYGAYRLHGWIMGKDGKKEEYWQKPKTGWQAAFFVPTSIINPPQKGLLP